MNLHAVVRGAVQAINSDIDATLRRSLGYTESASGKQEPQYQILRGRIQVQPLDTGMIQRANNLSLQGVLRTVYLFGNWFGIVRAGEKGGDMLCFADAGSKCQSEWLVVDVVEAWPDWTRVIVCLQSI